MSPTPLAFSKYSGCGNDFILVDNREQHWNLEVLFPKIKIAALCHRRQGIGADGIIFLENTLQKTYRMRIFNADGSEAEMCGNGVRCLTAFLRDLGLEGDNFDIQTMHHQVHAKIHSTHGNRHEVETTMPPVVDIAYSTRLTIEGSSHEMHCLNTGVPHAVLFVPNLECPSLMQLAPKIRFHPHFPKGTNVNFVSLVNDALYIRTYERGVEAETLACGTGATAAAIVASHVYKLSSPVCVYTRSTETLYIDTSTQHITMRGPALHLFNGLINVQ